MSAFDVWSPDFMKPEDAMTLEAHDSLDAAGRFRRTYERGAYKCGPSVIVKRPDGVECTITFPST